MAEGHGADMIWGWGWGAFVWKGWCHGASGHSIGVRAWCGGAAAGRNARRARWDVVGRGVLLQLDDGGSCCCRWRFNLKRLGISLGRSVLLRGAFCLREDLVRHLSFDGAAYRVELVDDLLVLSGAKGWGDKD